jgi:hypothetical protein
MQGISIEGAGPARAITGPRRASSRFHEVLSHEPEGQLRRESSNESGPAEKIIDRIDAGRKKLDWIIAQANSGRSFQPRELLAMQAEVYRAGEEIALVNKVVEAGMSSVKRLWSMQV